MKKFMPWLLPMVILLAAVPLLLMYEVAAPAKIAGVILVLLVSIALRFWLYNAGKLKNGKGRVKITINERHTLRELYPSYDRFPASSRKNLEERMGLLLADLSFDKADHSDVSRDECLLVALSLAIAFEKQSYKSAANKIVVLAETTNEQLTFQNNQPVLFVSQSDLKNFLAQLSGGLVTDPSGGTLVNLLEEFYSL